MNTIIIDNSGCEFLERCNGYCEKYKETVDCNKIQCPLKEYYKLAAERKITPIPGLTYAEAIEELVKIQKQIIKESNCSQMFPGQCHCAFRCLGNDFCEGADKKINEIKLKLQTQKQLYDELRQYHNECCNKYEKEKDELIQKYNQVSKDFYKGKYCNTEHCEQLKRKEQECESLKEIVKKRTEDLACSNECLLKKMKELQAVKQKVEELEKYKKMVLKLAGMQIILTNKDKMPYLYENFKDKKLELYKQALEEIKKELEEAVHCESEECGCDDAKECLDCTRKLILQKCEVLECET